jgi:hypothetical protein
VAVSTCGEREVNAPVDVPFVNVRACATGRSQGLYDGPCKGERFYEAHGTLFMHKSLWLISSVVFLTACGRPSSSSQATPPLSDGATDALSDASVASAPPTVGQPDRDASGHAAPTPLPAGMFANPKPGDWAAYEPTRGHLIEYSVVSVDDEAIALRINAVHPTYGSDSSAKTLSRQQPTFEELFSSADWETLELTTRPSERTIGGRHFPCIEVHMVTRSRSYGNVHTEKHCISAKIPGSGVVEGEFKGALVGFGTASKTTWGRRVF